MSWTEASGTYWMAVLILAILGYLAQKMLLYRSAGCESSPMHGPGYRRNPALPCDYLGAFSLGEFWGYLIRVFGTPLPVFFGKTLARLEAILTYELVTALVSVWIVLTAILLPLIIEIFVDRWYYGTNAFDNGSE